MHALELHTLHLPPTKVFFSLSHLVVKKKKVKLDNFIFISTIIKMGVKQ